MIYRLPPLNALRVFEAAARHLSFKDAAAELHITQAAVSHQVKSLEEFLGVQLFRRKPRGVELTDAGQVFLDGARSMFAILDRTLESTQRTARGEQGQISVGYTSGAAFHPLVQRAIREFRKGFPLVSVALAEGFPDVLIERMRNDQIDIAFIRTPVANPEGIAIDLLQEEAMVVALPGGHALTRNKKGGDAAVSLKALAGEIFIAFGSAHSALTMQSNTLVAACQAAGFSPRIGHVVSNNLSRLNLVAAGLGISVVSASMQRMHIDGVVYRRFKGVPQLKIPLNLVSRRGDASPVVRQFLKLAKQTAKNFRSEQESHPSRATRSRTKVLIASMASNDAGAPGSLVMNVCG